MTLRYPPAPPTAEWARNAPAGPALDAICAYYMGWVRERGRWIPPPGLSHYRSSFDAQTEPPNYSSDWRLTAHLMTALLQSGHGITPEKAPPQKPMIRYAANRYAKLAVARRCAEVVALHGFLNIYNPYVIA